MHVQSVVMHNISLLIFSKDFSWNIHADNKQKNRKPNTDISHRSIIKDSELLKEF